MRIGFIGSHGAGKTAVAETIANNDLVGRDFIFVPSAASKVIEAGMHLNEEADQVSQVLTTLARVVDEKRAFAEHPHKHVITDKTPLCGLAYTKHQVDRVWEKSDATRFYWDYSVKFVMQAMKDYDKLFYFPLPRLGFGRPQQNTYQYDIQDNIELFMNKFDLAENVIIVDQDTVPGRAHYVYKQIML